MLAHQTDPRWWHIRFMRLTSTREAEKFVAAVANHLSPACQTREKA